MCGLWHTGDPVGPAFILRVKVKAEYFSGTIIPIDKSTRRHTWVQKYMKYSVLAHSVYRKSDPLWELKPFLFLAVCRVALLKRVFYLILSVLQGVSFIMSRDSCPVQGHVEGRNLCRTLFLLQTLTMLPPVGETPALSAPVSRAHICLMKSRFCNDTQRAFSRNAFINAQNSEELIYTEVEAWNHSVSLLKEMTMRSGQAMPRARRLLLLLATVTVVAERQETAAMLRPRLRLKKGDHHIHRPPDFASRRVLQPIRRCGSQTPMLCSHQLCPQPPPAWSILLLWTQPFILVRPKYEGGLISFAST